MIVDGETIASREKGIMVRLFGGGGWPDEDKVVAEIDRRRKAQV